MFIHIKDEVTNKIDNICHLVYKMIDNVTIITIKKKTRQAINTSNNISFCLQYHGRFSVIIIKKGAANTYVKGYNPMKIFNLKS